MASFKSTEVNKRILSMGVVLGLCIPLVLVAQGKKGKRPNCQTITADAEFRDGSMDGIRSDGIWSPNPSKYLGLEDALVYLLLESDHDFVLDTRSKQIERETGVDRRLKLVFSSLNNLPFNPIQIVDTLIRVDEVLSVGTQYVTRFIMWFKIDRVSYRLVFDGLDDASNVLVTKTGNSPTRQWTIESTDSHTARLERLKGAKRFTVGHFIMSFKITVDETTKEPTCI